MKSIILFVAAAAVSFSGCTSSRGRSVYTVNQVHQAMRVELGTIVGVRGVMIDGEASNVGLYGGAVLGGATGSTVGSGAGSTIAGAAGAVGGMIAGRAIEKVATRKDGLEITVNLDNGQTLVIVQPEKDGGFLDGDRVRVMIGPRTAIVSH